MSSGISAKVGYKVPMTWDVPENYQNNIIYYNITNNCIRKVVAQILIIFQMRKMINITE